MLNRQVDAFFPLCYLFFLGLLKVIVIDLCLVKSSRLNLEELRLPLRLRLRVQVHLSIGFHPRLQYAQRYASVDWFGLLHLNVIALSPTRLELKLLWLQ